MASPIFFYDLGSPYAWLAAERIDDLFPVRPEWVPVLLGGIFRATGRASWGVGPDRPGGMAEVEERARRRGLPAVCWPDPWPNDGLHAMRVAAGADSRAFALAAFRAHFTRGLALSDPASVDRVVAECGIAAQPAKDRLRENTDRALSAGVFGVPPVVAGGQVFWGDDRLEDAVAASAPEQQLE